MMEGGADERQRGVVEEGRREGGVWCNAGRKRRCRDEGREKRGTFLGAGGRRVFGRAGVCCQS